MNSQHRSDHLEHLLKVSYLFVLLLVAHMDQQKQLSHNCHERMNRNANRPVNYSSSNHLLFYYILGSFSFRVFLGIYKLRKGASCLIGGVMSYDRGRHV